MKIIDSKEKELIKKIISYKNSGCKVLNLLDAYLTENQVNISLKNNVVTLMFEMNKDLDEAERVNDIINKRLPQIQSIILTLINLINYLEKNGFLTTFLECNYQYDIDSFGPCTNPGLVGYEFPDPYISELFSSYVYKSLMYTPELIELFDNNFLSKDEMRYRQQLLYTRLGIALSLGLGLYSIYASVSNEDSKKLNANLSNLNKSSETIIEVLKESQKLSVENSSKLIEKLSLVNDSVFEQYNDSKDENIKIIGKDAVEVQEVQKVQKHAANNN